MAHTLIPASDDLKDEGMLPFNGNPNLPHTTTPYGVVKVVTG